MHPLLSLCATIPQSCDCTHNGPHSTPSLHISPSLPIRPLSHSLPTLPSPPALPIWNGRWRVILYCSIATAIGAVLYPLGQYAKRKGWVTYLADPPRGVEDLVGAAPTHFEDVYDDEWATSTVTTEDGAGGDLEGQGLLGHARGGVRNGGAGLAVEALSSPDIRLRGRRQRWRSLNPSALLPG